MEFLIWFLVLAIIMAMIGALLGVFDQVFSPNNTISASLSKLDRRLHLVFGIMLGIQIVGTVSIAFLAFFVVMAGGGLDIVEFDPPGLNEACIMLPFVFPLTLFTYISYPKIKGRKWAQWLLIFTVVVNVLLAAPLTMVCLISVLIFSGL